ncbi:glycoside hydrolase family 28 protein [Saliterribacillus persicus]|uniref:Polygalacturonase n=1 Tax=Saliterribacillus persicus TaxID=930114 RepID=A0A368Y9F3_9BACI|nr:glycoside hydrolase family 28 protein [Saliterribacillus persicus]RCW76735.1 polygalacturonase [Saliterribacillus persicus]
MVFHNITSYGAKSDIAIDSTDAIQTAIDACENEGGGTVFVPSGRFLTGPIALKSNLTLHLEKGAILLFTDDFEKYPVVKTRWSGYVCHAFMPLIFADHVENTSITGEGVIDGQGMSWWKINRALREGKSYSSNKTEVIREANRNFTEPADTNLVEWPSQFLRPPLVQFYHAKHVTISGVTVKNSPFWNTHLVFCQDVSIHNVTFLNPSNTPNGDGLDIDSCENVRISDCHFDVGDDCVVLKSGINEDGRRYNVPTKNIVVTNCTMQHGHGGVVLGSESSGGIENITVSNCVFDGTDRGIRIKTNRERGSYIRNLLVSNIYMENVLCPLAINSFYRHGVSKSNPELLDAKAIPVTEKTPVVENIYLTQVIAKNCRAAAGFIYGLPEMPIKEVRISHSSFEMNGAKVDGGEPDMVREEIYMEGEGIFAKYVEDLRLHDVQIQTRIGPALILKESKDIALEQFELKNKQKDAHVVDAEAVKSLYIEGRQYETEKNSYLKEGERA